MKTAVIVVFALVATAVVCINAKSINTPELPEKENKPEGNHNATTEHKVEGNIVPVLKNATSLHKNIKIDSEPELLQAVRARRDEVSDYEGWEKKK